MLRIAIPVVCLLCSCAATPSTAPPSYDSYKQLQDQRQSYYRAWMAKADQAQTEFLSCVPSYAVAHLSSSLTASELALAAISACNAPLSNFRNDEQALYSLINQNNGTAEADRAVAQVTDAAKGMVLKQLAEKR